jgi:hypothetical protein
MKRNLLGSAVVLAWCVAAPVAQQQPPSTPSAPAHNVFVVTGCLNTGVERTAAFRLTDASPVGRTAPARAEDSRAVGTSGLKPSYDLQPASGVNSQGIDAEELKTHAGRRVEVTLRPVEATAPPAPPAGATLGGQAARPIDPPPQRYSVTAIKRVTGTCS